jgi:hypothetical protein
MLIYRPYGCCPAGRTTSICRRHHHHRATEYVTCKHRRSGHAALVADLASLSEASCEGVPFAAAWRAGCCWAPSPAFRSPERCLCTNRLGFRSSISKSANSGAQPFPQVVFCALGDHAQVAEGTAGLGGDRGQFVRPEDDKRDHRENQQLGDGQVEHRSALSPAAGLQRGQLVVG